MAPCWLEYMLLKPVREDRAGARRLAELAKERG